MDDSDGSSNQDFLSYLEHLESGGRNIPNTTQGTSSGQAQGYDQITTGTWREFAPGVGIDLKKYPNALSAPKDVQRQVASSIPLERWAPETLNGLKAAGFKVQPNLTLGQNITANGGSSNIGMLGSAPENDFLSGATSAKSAIANDAISAIAKGGPSILEQPTTDFLGSAAPSVAAAPTVDSSSTGGAIPIVAHDVGNGTLVGPAGNTVDRTQPIAQQLAAAGRSTLDYVKQQLSGVPGAVANDYNASTALNEQGNQELNSGHGLPSFPSVDPRTWSAGGALKAVGGLIGQVTSPLTGATSQLVEQPVTDATGNPLAGQAAGLVANSLAMPAIGRLAEAGPGAAANKMLGAMPAEDARLAQTATQKYGIPLTAPQLSTSPGLKIAGSTIDRLPLSGAGDQIAEQQSAFNKAVASTLGESADRITPDVMNAARKRIGGYYDSVAQNTNLKVDSQFAQDLHKTLNDASQTLPKAETEPLVKQAQKILEKIDPTTGTISGETYQALTNTGSPLDRLLNSENPNTAHYADGLKKALDGALARSASPEDQALLKTADKQWAAMRTIQPIVAKSPTGDVSPALLAGRVNASTSNGMAFGYGGDLGELARIGQRFLKEPGSSNTAERSATMIGLAKAAALPAALFAGNHYGMLNAATSLGALPATLIAGRLAGGALRSKGLSNALINRSLNPAVSSAYRPSFGALGGAGSLVNESVNPLGAGN